MPGRWNSLLESLAFTGCEGGHTDPVGSTHAAATAGAADFFFEAAFLVAGAFFAAAFLAADFRTGAGVVSSACTAGTSGSATSSDCGWSGVGAGVGVAGSVIGGHAAGTSSSDERLPRRVCTVFTTA